MSRRKTVNQSEETGSRLPAICADERAPQICGISCIYALSIANPLRKHQGSSQEQQINLQAKQGRVPYGVAIKLVDDDGNSLPHDGKTCGHLLVRGHMQITDRAKDLVKSGGEWISSISLENAAVGHPWVAEAAVIAIAHPKWQERPLMIVVKKPGCEITKQQLLNYLSDKVAKWWLPDDIVLSARFRTLPRARFKR